MEDGSITDFIIFGDSHGDVEYIKCIMREYGDSVYYIHVGDLCQYESLPEKLWLCPGNHDSWEICKNIFYGSIKIENLVVIPFASIIYFDDIKVGFIPWNFKSSRFENIHMCDAITKEAINIIHGYGQKLDLMVSHEPPGNLHDFGIECLNNITNHCAPIFWTYGHHHRAYEKEYRGVKGICVPNNSHVLVGFNDELRKDRMNLLKAKSASYMEL